MRSNVTIEANGIIPISEADVSNIPTIAYSIPDFEGEAILRIFANSTQEEIGCYSAVITNGATFAQPAIVGSILGVFTAVAVVASLVTTIYGDSVPVMRKHYAHSMSVFVVFAVFQHIFYTGALSMNWPSVLVAFWSNYAWAGGMIYSEQMQNSINQFIGSNKGNVSAVGAAGVGVQNSDLGGGYDIHKIYGRSLKGVAEDGILQSGKLFRRAFESRLARRQLADASQGFTYYGKPVKPGLPLPGNYSGLAGTLGQEDIPVSNAFMTGFLWFLIMLAIAGGAVAALKWILEGLSTTKLIKQDRLAYFRTHWVGYSILALLRTFFIGFFMMTLLTVFQFTYQGGAGAMAIAATVFCIFFIGMFGAVAYAYYYKYKSGNYALQNDQLLLERRRVLKIIPWYRFHLATSSEARDSSKAFVHAIPFWSLAPTITADAGNSEKGEAVTVAPLRMSVHDDVEYTKKFGWLFSRFRRTRWWFFGPWILYEFIRACFYAGASGHAMVQVFGLLVVEIIAFVAIIILRPFEGQRLNAIVVYLLGFSKVVTVALSAAFDIRFNLARIPCTVIGVVIIVVQGILTIVLLIGIILGAITSYFSITRYRESIKPRSWIPWREKYFRHLDSAEKDLAPEIKPAQVVLEEGPKEPYFNVNSVRRMAKIEDEDAEFQADLRGESIPNIDGTHTLKESTTSPFPAFSEPIPESDEYDDDQLPPINTSPTDGAASPTPVAESRTPKRRASKPTSRPTSVQSNAGHSGLPFGARVHRRSWNSRDFSDWQERGMPERSRSLTLRTIVDSTIPAATAQDAVTSVNQVSGSATPSPIADVSPIDDSRSAAGATGGSATGSPSRPSSLSAKPGKAVEGK